MPTIMTRWTVEFRVSPHDARGSMEFRGGESIALALERATELLPGAAITSIEET